MTTAPWCSTSPTTSGHAAGRWRVETSGGEAKVSRTDDAADVTLDAETLGALYLGGIDTPTLAAVGRLRGEPGRAGDLDGDGRRGAAALQHDGVLAETR